MIGYMAIVPLFQIRRMGWIGVEVKDGVMVARFGSCFWFREKVFRLPEARCRVKLEKGSSEWPNSRVCGVWADAAYGIFRTSRGNVYFLADEGCGDKAVHIEVDGLKLVVCTPPEKVINFFNSIVGSVCSQ